MSGDNRTRSPHKPTTLVEHDEAARRILLSAEVSERPSLGAFRRDPEVARAAQEQRRQKASDLKAFANANRSEYTITRWELAGEFSHRRFVERIDIQKFQTSMLDSTSRGPDSALPNLTRAQLIEMNDTARETIVGAFKKLGALSEAAGWIIPAGKAQAKRIKEAYDGVEEHDAKAAAVDSVIRDILSETKALEEKLATDRKLGLVLDAIMAGRK